MCKNAGLLIGFDLARKRALIAQASCKQWACPECNSMMKNQWIMRANIGVHDLIAHDQVVDFVTITSNEKLTTFAQTIYVWRGAWKNLYAALKYQNPLLQYMLVPERHKDGRMHVHALWTANVSKRWLKDNARKRGLGYMF